jgi:hypothetical protein
MEIVEFGTTTGIASEISVETQFIYGGWSRIVDATGLCYNDSTISIFKYQWSDTFHVLDEIHTLYQIVRWFPMDTTEQYNTTCEIDTWWCYGGTHLYVGGPTTSIRLYGYRYKSTTTVVHYHCRFIQRPEEYCTTTTTE